MPEVPSRAHGVKEPIFGTVFGGGVDERKFCQSGPLKTHFGMSQRLADEN